MDDGRQEFRRATGGGAACRGIQSDAGRGIHYRGGLSGADAGREQMGARHNATERLPVCEKAMVVKPLPFSLW